MNIGIDIDNVISNFDDELLKEYLIHDKKLRGAGIINKEACHIRNEMFDWSKEEDNNFYYANIQRIAMNLKPLHNCKYFIDKLISDGNKIYIISGRNNGEYDNPIKVTKDWLKKYEIKYDNIFLTDAYDKKAKTSICINNNIDIMIEDNVSICKDLKENGIKIMMMETRFNKNTKGFEMVSSWEEIYSKICALYPKKKIEKINVILDTDTYNECDDQFALSYMIKSQDRFNVEAITIAPYHHDNSISIYEGTEKSYEEVEKICKYLNFESKNKVFKGSTDYVCNGYYEKTEAVKKIIEVANKNEKTYIMAIGALTNIAIALKKEPKIIDKIEVIWLGGNSILSKNNDEFNFRQDVQAVKEVFNSKVKLTVIPCKNVASNLTTSIYELEHYLKDKNGLCNYLCSRFYNDGKHGITPRRVIWDISVIAYLINKDWFYVTTVNCPNINEDTSYEINTNNHKIDIVNYIDVNKVYNDLFQKLGG